MQIEEKPFELDLEQLRSGLSTDSVRMEPRSPGWHLSDIIQDLVNRVVSPGKYKLGVDLTPDDIAQRNRYFEMGFLWEQVIEAAFKQRQVDGLDGKKYLRQAEVETDGVYSTVDGIHIPDWRVLEYKLSFRSSNKASLDRIESEFWSWFVQLRWNCLAHQTRLATLFVFFVNGNYHPPVPQTKRFDIIFTEEELIDNRSMLLQHKATMEIEGRVPDAVRKVGARARRDRPGKDLGTSKRARRPKGKSR